jgi:hypothetical protein
VLVVLSFSGWALVIAVAVVVAALYARPSKPVALPARTLAQCG